MVRWFAPERLAVREISARYLPQDERIEIAEVLRLERPLADHERRGWGELTVLVPES